MLDFGAGSGEARAAMATIGRRADSRLQGARALTRETCVKLVAGRRSVACSIPNSGTSKMAL
jgi:hypothetical protein